VIQLRSIDRRVGIVAVVTLLLVAVAVGAVFVTRDDSDSTGASPGAASTITNGTDTLGTGSTPPATDDSPPRTVVVRAPIGLSKTGDFGTGLVVKLSKIASVPGKAQAPGDIAGPAIRVEVEATNRSSDPISLESAQVALEYGSDRTPASTTSGHDARRFSPSLAPGKSSTAAFIFRVPPDQRDRLRVTVSYSLDAPTIVFAGSAT
jgi:hypothetical protein